MPLEGTLQDLGLSSLIQLQCNEQKTVQLQLNRHSQQGKMIFAEGELIHAEFGNLVGEPAVYELLTWTDGEFHVTDFTPPLPMRTVQTPWSALVLEGLRLVDEAREHADVEFQNKLRELCGKQGLRGAIATDLNGVLHADAANQNASQRAALIAFLVQCAETLGINLGAAHLNQLTCATANEKMWIIPVGGYLVGCWVDARAPDSLKATIQSLAQSVHPAQ
jgi:hypothetical protein